MYSQNNKQNTSKNNVFSRLKVPYYGKSSLPSSKDGTSSKSSLFKLSQSVSNQNGLDNKAVRKTINLDSASSISLVDDDGVTPSMQGRSIAQLGLEIKVPDQKQS